MRKFLFAALLAAGAAVAPFAAAPVQGVAMTCSPNPDPVDYTCDVLFGTVGAICRGEVPPVPSLPYIEFGWSDPSLDLCPPLG